MKRAYLTMSILAAACGLATAQERPEPTKAQAPATTVNTNPVITEADFDVPVDKLWWVFSTDDGFKMLGAAKAKIDFRVGGKMQSHYSPAGVIGDEGTIENTIIAYEPNRVLAWRITKPPKNFPFMSAYKDIWSVATFTDAGGGKSHLRLAQVGYTPDEESQKMRAFFDQGNKWVIDKLQQNLSGAPKGDARGDVAAAADPLAPIVTEAVIAAMPADVWKCWTTHDGFKGFLGTENKIELKVGGPFEVYFSMEPPAGQRGSEGCTILSYEPESMLSFSWNAPPKFKWGRDQHTWVVVKILPAGAHGSKVVLKQMGFAELAAASPEHAEEAKQIREYFNNAWPRVLGALKEHYAPAK